MSKIVISGYYGFNNAGDEAMLTAILASLRAADPQVELTVISGNPTDTRSRHKVESVYRFNALKIRQVLREADLLISGGGSLLQDVTSKKSLFYYLTILAAAKLMGKKVMLYAQGIGPIRNKLMRSVTHLIVNRVDMITVRDNDSAAELEQMGVDRNLIQVTADAVMSLERRSRYKGLDLLLKAGLDPERPMIGVSVRRWSDDTECYRELGKALGRLCEREKVQIVLLPLQYPADIEACEWLSSFISADNKDIVLLRGPYSTEEFMSVIGNLKILIGMRLHALIFAAVMQVPLLAVSYDPKVDSFVREIGGRAAGSVTSLTASQVVDAVNSMWDRIPEKQNERMEALRLKALTNTVKAFALLKQN